MQAQILLRLLQAGLILVPLAVWPFLQQPFETTKWAVLYAIAFLCVCAWFVKSPRPVEIRVRSRDLAWLLAVAGLYLLAILGNWNKEYKQVYLDWITFFVLTWSSYLVIKRCANWYAGLRSALYLAGGISLALSFSQFLGLDPISLWRVSEGPKFPTAIWGFQNFYSEFLGLLAILLTFDLVYRRGSVRMVTIVFLLATLVCLGVQQTRSVFVALAMALFFLLVSKIKRSALLAALIFSSIVAVFFLRGELRDRDVGPQASSENISSAQVDLSALKKANTKIRLIRWRNTLAMIGGHPWGVGPGKFPYAYLSYRSARDIDREVTEERVAYSPHNGYLEYIVENGWSAAAVLFLFLGYMLAGRAFALSRRNRKQDCFRIILIYFLVDAFFSFPMEVPFPFFVAAILLGFWLKHSARGGGSFGGVRLSLPPLARMVGASLMIWLGGAWAYSQIAFSFHSDSYQIVARACTCFSDTWQNCFRQAQLESEMAKPIQALKTLGAMLKREENLFPAIRLTAVAAFQAGKPQMGCLALAKYEKLFPERRAQDSDWRPMVQHYCQR